jgi:hypothetical protein
MIGYQMTWSATVKTVEASNFFKEVPDIIKKFKITLPINLLVIVSRAIWINMIPYLICSWRLVTRLV